MIPHSPQATPLGSRGLPYYAPWHRTCSTVPYYSDLRSLAESARRHLHFEQWPVLLLDATAHIASRLGGRTVHDRARLVRVRVRVRVWVRVKVMLGVRVRVRGLG